MSAPADRDPPGEAPTPIGVVRREARWPASLAVLATVALYLTLPDALTPGPRWLFPALALALLVPLWALAPHRLADEPPWHRALAVALIALVNAANAASLVLLVSALLHGSKEEGRALIANAVQIWLTNVLVFGLWYWELDRSGPGARCRPDQDAPDFLFPQMQLARADAAFAGWYPTFVDYLYVSLTNAAAFSPTDTLPLSPWAKLLMGAQALVSLLTVGFVAARAVNILG